MIQVIRANNVAGFGNLLTHLSLCERSQLKQPLLAERAAADALRRRRIAHWRIAHRKMVLWRIAQWRTVHWRISHWRIVNQRIPHWTC